jgi:hypothetical protein
MRQPALATEGLVVALVPDARAVGDEDLVEQAALGRLGQLDVVVDVDAGVGLRARMAPGRDVMAGGRWP